MSDDGRRNEAMARLAALVSGAARDLAPLGPDVMVAASPNAWDDIGYYPDWLGVQVGRAFWERTDYRLESGGDVEERARNPDDLPAARAVLERLQGAGWRTLAEQAAGYAFTDEVLAVVIQHGASWFVVSGTNGGSDEAFVVGGGGLVLVGEPDRLDQRLGRPLPLMLRKIDAAGWPVLQATAPYFPCARLVPSPEPDAVAARGRLAGLLKEAFVKLRAVPGVLRYAAAARADPEHHGYGHRPWRSVAVDGRSATRQGATDDKWYARQLEACGPAGTAIDGALTQLQAAGWFDLFAQGMMPLAYDEPLALLVRGSECRLVVAQTAVFDLSEDGTLTLAGACDRIAGGHAAGSCVIHPFDDVANRTRRT